jgi:hypothetical protein
MVTPQSLPPGTQIVRQADWEWRVTIVRDERAEIDRPAPTRLEPLPSDTQVAADAKASYRQVASSHPKHLRKLNHSRQILFANNLAVIRFERRQEGGRDVNGMKLSSNRLLYQLTA